MSASEKIRRTGREEWEYSGSAVTYTLSRASATSEWYAVFRSEDGRDERSSFRVSPAQAMKAAGFGSSMIKAFLTVVGGAS